MTSNKSKNEYSTLILRICKSWRSIGFGTRSSAVGNGKRNSGAGTSRDHIKTFKINSSSLDVITLMITMMVVVEIMSHGSKESDNAYTFGY